MAPRTKPSSAGKTAATKSKATRSKASAFAAPAAILAPALPPSRVHGTSYHYPLLLNDRAACEALLTWFSGVEETRSMPWRKRWIDPNEYVERDLELGSVLAKRAYEVWVSEVMLQQTRVSTVIPYFNNWISKWPTVQDLADANHDDVLSVWKGLGYYSRATRLQEGAKAVIDKRSGEYCLVPSSAVELQELPGIGRYTAGAISSIAFGKAEPVLDGNVARVLSRQLGLYMDVKDKKASDIIWDVADELIKYVSGDPDTQTSVVPGQWNQALMELGSTICTPRPRCDDCPIQKTCRVYSEGQALSEKGQKPVAITDIEDACSLCETLDTEDLVIASKETATDEPPRATKKRKVEKKQANTLSHYFAIGTPKSNAELEDDKNSDKPSQTEDLRKRKTLASTGSSKLVLNYCALYPKKIAKKKVAEEDCTVCIIELRMPNGDSKWLIEQRPDKGLLASLWQFPQNTLSATQTTLSQRKTSAQQHMSSLDVGKTDMRKAQYIAQFPPLVHVFTHLKLTMHSYHYKITADTANDADLSLPGVPARRWVDTDTMDNETLSTGMRKCWEQLLKSL